MPSDYPIDFFPVTVDGRPTGQWRCGVCDVVVDDADVAAHRAACAVPTAPAETRPELPDLGRADPQSQPLKEHGFVFDAISQYWREFHKPGADGLGMPIGMASLADLFRGEATDTLAALASFGARSRLAWRTHITSQ